MNTRKWVYLFWTTLLMGGGAGIVVGGLLLILSGDVHRPVDWLVGSLWNFGAGMMFSIASQMGLFAYLFVHQMMLNLFKSPFLFHSVQIFLLLVALGDVVYLRHAAFGDNGGYLPYAALPVLLLVVGLVVAFWKSHATNPTAFVPTLFYMVVFTLLEGFPALRQNNALTLFFMLGPIFVCNTWQILQLHRLTGSAPIPTPKVQMVSNR